ncbi:hypothetical protein L6R53_33465 [Myxococcota bacterium]|nr:hypothetical protein [Myxococcota bacterium]
MLALAGVPGRAEGAPPGAGAAMPSAPSLAPAWGVAVEPPEEPVRQRERRAAAGGAAAELACEPLAEAVLLCLTVQVDGGYRYATQADLASWGLSLGQARAAATARARASLGPGRPEEVAVIDMPRTYRLSAEGDGLDHAAVLAPDLLSAWYGEGVRLAVPGRDVLLAWPAGDEELDRVMAVGVARIHEASDHPVTARVYTWDAAAGAWQVWGQAVR